MRIKQKYFTKELMNYISRFTRTFELLLLCSLLWTACGSPTISNSTPGVSSTVPRSSPVVRDLTPTVPKSSPTAQASPPVPILPKSSPTASSGGASSRLSCTIVPLRPEELYSRGFVLKCTVNNAPLSDTSFSLQLQDNSASGQSNKPTFLCSAQLSKGAGICGRQIIIPPTQSVIGAGLTIFGNSLPSHISLGPVSPIGAPVKHKAPPA